MTSLLLSWRTLPPSTLNFRLPGPSASRDSRTAQGSPRKHRTIILGVPVARFVENLTICKAFAAGFAGLNSFASQLMKRLNMLGFFLVASGLVGLAVDSSKKGVPEGSIKCALTTAGVEISLRS